jgi:hypothetical protein
MVLSKLPKVTQNPLTGSGVFLTTVSALLFILFFVVDLFGLHANPYLGIVFFLVLPGVFVLGLLLIPLGVWRERRRRLRGLPPSQWHYPHVDLNNALHRRIVAVVAALTVVNVLIISLAAYRGLEYMDSVSFCGQVCHTVMEPEFVAYTDGPHARVACVECHIGPGAPWLVKSKIDGIRQVVAVALDTYERPVPSPVHDLRPARDTCEHCHWPDKFTGDLVRTFPSFGDDEANTASHTTLQLRVGGGGWRFGGPHGIHWHTSLNHRVEYITTDANRQTIPWVRLTDVQGRVTEYVVDGVTPEALAAGERRTMDCVDCHNRPSHRFQPTPEKAVDTALLMGLIPTSLPYIRREAVAAVKEAYPDRGTAEQAIRARLEQFYAREYAGQVRPDDPRLSQAISGAQRVYTHNVFPVMKLTWGTHPNHLGHTDSPGCFRCHDEEHRSKDGRVISQDCETCHRMVD